MANPANVKVETGIGAACRWHMNIKLRRNGRGVGRDGGGGGVGHLAERQSLLAGALSGSLASTVAWQHSLAHWANRDTGNQS